MSDELIEALTATHNDTWPLQIGHGSLINEDGPEAAAEITRLREEVERLQPSTLKIDHLRKQLDRAESEIGALRSLLAEARSGLGALVELHDAWREEPGNQADAYYMIAKRHGTWDLARALIARIGEVSDGKE